MKKEETLKRKHKPLSPVVLYGRKYFGIKYFDCIVVHLYTEKTLQGTFFTAMAISNAEFRREHPTMAKVEIESNNDWTMFKIFNDCGQLYVIEIHNSLSKEIEFAKTKAAEYGLL